MLPPNDAWSSQFALVSGLTAVFKFIRLSVMFVEMVRGLPPP